MDFGIGEIIGALISADSASDQLMYQKNADNAKKLAAKKAGAAANTGYDQLLELLQNYKAGQTNYATDAMKQQYQDLIANYNPENYDYDFGEFSYDKSVEDYLNPNKDAIAQDAANAVMRTAAGAGMGRSGFTAKDMASAVVDKNEELYKDAYNMYNTDRNFEYNKYSNYINQMQNKYNNLANLTSNKINLLSGAINHDETQESDYMKDLISLMSDKISTNVNTTMNS